MDIGVLVQVGLLISSSLLAIFTWRLYESTNKVANRTQELADDNVAANRLADRHHQEQLRPIIIWDVEIRGVGPEHASGLNLSGNMRNIGPGPALDVWATLKLNSAEFKTTQKRILAGGSGGTNDAWRFEHDSKSGTIDSRRDFPAYTVTIYYANIFGEVGTTTLSRTKHGSEGPIETRIDAPPINESRALDTRTREGVTRGKSASSQEGSDALRAPWALWASALGTVLLAAATFWLATDTHHAAKTTEADAQPAVVAWLKQDAVPTQIILQSASTSPAKDVSFLCFAIPLDVTQISGLHQGQYKSPVPWIGGSVVQTIPLAGCSGYWSGKKRPPLIGQVIAAVCYESAAGQSYADSYAFELQGPGKFVNADPAKYRNYFDFAFRFLRCRG